MSTYHKYLVLYIFIIQILGLLYFPLGAVENKIIASDAETNDQFGSAVSISGDFLVVGAQGKFSKGGVAYIYAKNQGGAGNWGFVKRINANDRADEDRFGASVAIDGDYIVVGSPLDDDDGDESGSAYVFYRNQGGNENWGQVAKLTASDAADSDSAQFGVAVSISGDLIVVGAHFADYTFPTLTNAGAAYVFDRNEGGIDNWGQTDKLTASDADSADFFGHAVSISGDNIAVGAWGNQGIPPIPGNDAGAVYPFHLDQFGIWNQQGIFRPDVPGEGSLGKSISINGDYIAAGTPMENEAYIYFRSGDSWAQQDKLTNINVSDRFGESISIYGDFILVGAPFDDHPSFNQAGSIFAFLWSGTTWNQTSKITASDLAAGDWFGTSVALNSEFGVVGAPYGDDYVVPVSNCGAVYMYETIADLSLPVTLASFDAEVHHDGVHLVWITESEVNNAGFRLLRSDRESGDYWEIASYLSDPELLGQFNSSSRHVYHYIDKENIAGHTYWYRLVDVDVSGKQSIHEPISITVSTLASEFRLYPAYPNPFNPVTHLKIQVPELPGSSQVIELSIYNILGQKVKNIHKGILQAGEYEFNWQGESDAGVPLSGGIYFVNLRAAQFRQMEKVIYLK